MVKYEKSNLLFKIIMYVQSTYIQIAVNSFFLCNLPRSFLRIMPLQHKKHTSFLRRALENTCYVTILHLVHAKTKKVNKKTCFFLYI